MSEQALEDFGFRPDESLVKVTKKLVCSKCGSKAVSAYRYLDDDLQQVFPSMPTSSLSFSLLSLVRSRPDQSGFMNSSLMATGCKSVSINSSRSHPETNSTGRTDFRRWQRRSRHAAGGQVLSHASVAVE